MKIYSTKQIRRHDRFKIKQIKQKIEFVLHRFANRC